MNAQCQAMPSLFGSMCYRDPFWGSEMVLIFFFVCGCRSLHRRQTGSSLGNSCSHSATESWKNINAYRWWQICNDSRTSTQRNPLSEHQYVRDMRCQFPIVITLYSGIHICARHAIVIHPAHTHIHNLYIYRGS